MQWFKDLALQPGGYWVAIVILALLACITVIAVVALIQWRKLRQSEQMAALAQEMIQRGKSADEVLQILAASADTPAKPRRPAPVRLPETADYKG